MKLLDAMKNASPPEVPSYLDGGRTRQKLRTRTALVAAAKALTARGLSPTVDDAAAAADISRTTAYRYFKNQAELLAAAHPEAQARSLLGDDPPSDPEARLEIVVRKVTQTILEGEAQYRTMLRLSLEDRSSAELPYLRRGRAIGWIEDALSPLANTFSKADLKRLVLAVRTAIGIEALVWLTDVAGLTRPEAVKNMRWSALALLRAAISENAAKQTRKP